MINYYFVADISFIISGLFARTVSKHYILWVKKDSFEETELVIAEGASTRAVRPTNADESMGARSLLKSLLYIEGLYTGLKLIKSYHLLELMLRFTSFNLRTSFAT